jgi:hypothetical protein
VKAKLAENGIELVELVAHSSQLTQPLDVVVFRSWKNIINDMHVPEDLENLQARRLAKVTKALWRCLDPITVRNAWAKAGWTVAGNRVMLDINKILKHDQAPVNDVKVKEQSNKRVKVPWGETGQEKKRKAKQIPEPPEKLQNLPSALAVADISHLL